MCVCALRLGTTRHGTSIGVERRTCQALQATGTVYTAGLSDTISAAWLSLVFMTTVVFGDEEELTRFVLFYKKLGLVTRLIERAEVSLFL